MKITSIEVHIPQTKEFITILPGDGLSMQFDVEGVTFVYDDLSQSIYRKEEINEDKIK